MKNIKIILEYDGTNYHGFQIQKNSITIQEIVQDVILKITGEEAKITFASRTDAGVHAVGQVINFHTACNVPADRFALAMNSLLPGDIVAKESKEVDVGFHARFDACSKVYKYSILNGQYPSAFMRNYAYHYKGSLDVKLMIEASRYIIGCQDFSAFCAKGTGVNNFVRTVVDLQVEIDDNLINIFIEADGFLYNMVRIIVGTLIETGRGKIRPCDIQRIIREKNRNNAGPTVPARGLFLIKVNY